MRVSDATDVIGGRSDEGAKVRMMRYEMVESGGKKGVWVWRWDQREVAFI